MVSKSRDEMRREKDRVREREREMKDGRGREMKDGLEKSDDESEE